MSLLTDFKLRRLLQLNPEEVDYHLAHDCVTVLPRRRYNINIDCLTFAEDFNFSETAKVGLRISYEKSELVTNIKAAPKRQKIGEKGIERGEKLKHLGKWLKAFGSRTQK